MSAPDRSAEHGFAPVVRSVENGFRPFARSAENGFTSARRSAEHGFTLIELMVALAVFSIAALALLRLEGATLTSTASLADRTIGQIVARNLAVEALTDPVAPSFGETKGVQENAGRAWRWTRRSIRATQVNLQQIDIAVVDDNGQPAGALTVFRPMP
ncbi:general secretion pathway protein I [Sphingomonas laterariae]|uniref:Type II secretion system protein I n=1 Tax=Edaphosphingomonas laterariae TaxID=861865 RepID=A0A239JF85_9SPHN|nr:type II secretion system minor pseudopilin GspI [Sphingomonas laterariae]SNS04522.1 general secretion pathway protein I [Sphingomonas laterariae]SNT04088.1 general secretion pathway protein I [Sphingomonas laterariae]